MDFIEKIIEAAYKNNKKINSEDILDLNLEENEYEILVNKLKQNGIEIIIEEENDMESFVDLIDDAVNQYFSYIKKIKVLTPEEEVKLFKEYNSTGDKKIRERIIESNLKLVASMVRKYSKYNFQSIDMMDMIQEGNKGLIKAIDDFDLSKGYKFSTYAVWWIRQNILRYIHNNARIIRVPVYVIGQNSKIEKYSEDRYKETGEYPKTSEIADNLNIPRNQVNKVTKIIKENVISLETRIIKNTTDDDDFYLIDILPNDDKSVEDEVVDKITATNIMNVAKKILTPNQYIAFSMGLGIVNDVNDCPYPMKNNEIAKYLGKVTEERVRQLQERAIEKIKLYLSKGTYRKPRKKVKKKQN